MTVKKIISGGQTGADRAALDFAMEYGIPHGGWVPEGRKAEDGVIPGRYDLTELPGGDYAARTVQNVIDSDGTLIVSHGRLTGGSLLTWVAAEKHGKPVLHVDMEKLITFDAAIDIHEWMEANDVGVLNVAGSRVSKDPEIYRTTWNVLETVFHIAIIASSMPGMINQADFEKNRPPMSGAFPRSVEEAVDYLMKRLSSMEKMRVASAEKESLKEFTQLLEKQFSHEPGNTFLNDDPPAENAGLDVSQGFSKDGKDTPMLILRLLWERLRQSGHLRVIK